MSAIKKDQLFHRPRSSERQREFIEAVAQALREDYGDFNSAVKTISRHTGAHPRAVRNWYEGRNLPGSMHLILLSRTSPALLRFVLRQIGGAELWEASQLGIFGDSEDDGRQQGQAHSTDKNVSLNLSASLPFSRKTNARQLWFLQRLGSGLAVNASDFASEWAVSIRTAHRDINGLQQQGLIEFVGGKRNGSYSLKMQLTDLY